MTQALDQLVAQHIAHAQPFDRLRAGHSLPLIAISSPLFDQHTIFPNEAWAGIGKLIAEIQAIDPEFYGQNTFPLFIAGGAIGESRYMFSKTEGARLLQTDYSDTPFSQEAFGDLRERFSRVREAIAQLPQGVAVKYVYSEKDEKNMIEMFSQLMDVFSYRVMDIYNAMRTTPRLFQVAERSARAAAALYDKELGRHNSRRELHMAKRVEENESRLIGYDKAEMQHTETVNTTRAAYESAFAELQEIRTARRTIDERVDEPIGEGDRPESAGAAKRDLLTREKQLEKQVLTLEGSLRRIETELSIVRAERAEEQARYPHDVAELEQVCEQKKHESFEKYRNTVEQGLRELQIGLGERKRVIDETASWLVANFNVPTMMTFKRQFDAISEFYDWGSQTIAEFVDGDRGFEIWDVAIPDLKPLTSEMDKFLSGHEWHYQEMRQDFSISEMFSRVTKRKVPLQFRAELLDHLVYRQYKDWMIEALSDGGTRPAEVRDGYSGVFRLLDRENHELIVNMNGFGGINRRDVIKSRRNSLLSSLQMRSKNLFEITDADFLDNPFSPDGRLSEPTDPAYVAEMSYNNEKIDLILAGPYRHFSTAVVSALQSPHVTYASSLGPFFDTRAAIRMDARGTKTEEQKMALFKFFPGALLFELGGGMGQSTPFSLEQLARFETLDYATVPGYHDGDEHVGSPLCNVEALLGFYAIASRDTKAVWRINTGDNVDGEIRSYARVRNAFEGLRDLTHQFTSFFALETELRESLEAQRRADPNALVTNNYYSIGQHDIGHDAIRVQEIVVNALKISAMSPAERYLLPFHIRARQQGWQTPLDQHGVEVLAHSNEGFGIASLAYNQYPDAPFANIFVSHSIGLQSKKASKFDPLSTIDFWNGKLGLRSGGIALSCVGDKHVNIFGRSSMGFFDMTGSFKSTNRRPEKHEMQFDEYTLHFGVYSPPSVSRLFVPTHPERYPVSALHIPGPVMDFAYGQVVQPLIDEHIGALPQEQKRALLVR